MAKQQQSQYADSILTGGTFWTVDPDNPWAQAIAINAGRIIAIGQEADVLKYKNRKTKIIDIGGRFALPGFNDAHVHPGPNLLENAARYGITTLQVITEVHQIGFFEQLQKEGKLHSRVLLRSPIDILYAGWENLQNILKNHGKYLKYFGVKAYADGILGNKTALLLDDYKDCPNYKGITRADLTCGGVLETLVRKASEHQIPIGIHAIGDKANRLVLNLYERVIKQMNLEDHRFRVIHAQLVHPDDIPHFGDLDLVAEVNPLHIVADMPWIEKKIGRKRIRLAYQLKSLSNSGALLCFGSDYPGPTINQPYSINPLVGIYAAVTRQDMAGNPPGGWNAYECVGIKEAIEAYTLNPAIASFEEHDKGSLSVGKLADITILSHNLFDIPAKTILESDVECTLVGGKIIHYSQDFLRESLVDDPRSKK